ncbi:MAG: hypothetical protein ACTS73_05190 [Arsenophonus sp. NEOnobi-MAG3]
MAELLNSLQEKGGLSVYLSLATCGRGYLNHFLKMHGNIFSDKQQQRYWINKTTNMLA